MARLLREMGWTDVNDLSVEVVLGFCQDLEKIESQFWVGDVLSMCQGLRVRDT